MLKQEKEEFKAAWGTIMGMVASTRVSAPEVIEMVNGVLVRFGLTIFWCQSQKNTQVSIVRIKINDFVVFKKRISDIIRALEYCDDPSITQCAIMVGLFDLITLNL